MIPKSLIKKFLPKLAESLSALISDPYSQFELEEGEADFSTELFETNRGQDDSRLICRINTINNKGERVRTKLYEYDFQAAVNETSKEI